MADILEFENAVKLSQTITDKPTNEILLQLYSLYKQATEGDVKGDRPGGFDFKGAAKYDAWAGQKGKSKDNAADEYIALVNKLLGKDV
jgi:diazepam-binding inhibitor (GABA receptor modulator, acyl-CoA-binding protein)